MSAMMQVDSAPAGVGPRSPTGTPRDKPSEGLCRCTSFARGPRVQLDSSVSLIAHAPVEFVPVRVSVILMVLCVSRYALHVQKNLLRLFRTQVALHDMK